MHSDNIPAGLATYQRPVTTSPKGECFLPRVRKLKETRSKKDNGVTATQICKIESREKPPSGFRVAPIASHEKKRKNRWLVFWGGGSKNRPPLKKKKKKKPL